MYEARLIRSCFKLKASNLFNTESLSGTFPLEFLSVREVFIEESETEGCLQKQKIKKRKSLHS